MTPSGGAAGAALLLPLLAAGGAPFGGVVVLVGRGAAGTAAWLHIQSLRNAQGRLRFLTHASCLAGRRCRLLKATVPAGYGRTMLNCSAAKQAPAKEGSVCAKAPPEW